MIKRLLTIRSALDLAFFFWLWYAGCPLQKASEVRHPFRHHHLLTLLAQFDEQTGPLDGFLRLYFRQHKAIGAKDRKEITETAYALIRWRGLLDHLGRSLSGLPWEQRLSAFLQNPPESYLDQESIPLHIRCSFPQPLFDRFAASHGLEETRRLCLVSNEKAPFTIRANALKCTRDQLLEKFAGRYPVEPCQLSPTGIRFLQRVDLLASDEYRDGLFEIQDEASQCVSRLIASKPGQHVMDYCAGAGGKALAIAPLMENRGQLFLHDVRSHILVEARKRLRRAGIQNAQFLDAEEPHLKKLKKRMDWVIADVPCSGTGTLRRNPDLKWKLTEETLNSLVGQQRNIFEKALSFLRPDGRIVYTTCSLLHEENEEQVAHFQKVYNLKVDGESFSSLPRSGEMDGFFGVVLHW